MEIPSKTSCEGFLLSIILILFLMLSGCQKTELSRQDSEGFVQRSDGIELSYRIKGAGRDTIVVLHGGPGLHSDYLAPDLEPLAERYTVIFYDQRGSGRSTIVSDSASLHIENHIEDLEAVRQYLGIERLNLFGHSWGSLLGSRYALNHPEHISKLVLVSPGPVRMDPYDEQFLSRVMAWMDSTTLAQIQTLQAAFQNPNEEDDLRSVCTEFFEIFKRGYFYNPDDLDIYHRMQGDFCSVLEASLRNFWTVNTSTLQSIGDFDWRHDFSDLDIPVLVITGTRDVFPVENYQEWKAAFPDARLILINGAGHYPHVEKPDQFFEAIHEFLDK